MGLILNLGEVHCQGQACAHHEDKRKWEDISNEQDHNNSGECCIEPEQLRTQGGAVWIKQSVGHVFGQCGFIQIDVLLGFNFLIFHNDAAAGRSRLGSILGLTQTT